MKDLGIHYSTAIVPARVFLSKDKNRAEAAVNGITTWLIAALRHEVFFSVAETNAVVKIKLQEYNAKAFSAREGSRQSVFESEEQSVLTPLPAEAYQFPQWKKAIVQPSYHICVLNQFYSTPYPLRILISVMTSRAW